MTYVAQYFHAFSSQNKVETAGRRLRKLTEVLQYVYKMKTDYEIRALAVLAGIKELKAEWAAKDERIRTIQEVYLQLEEFKRVRRSKKRTLLSEKNELDQLLEDIQTRLATYHLPPYETPLELEPSEIQMQWASLITAEESYHKTLVNDIEAAKELLCRQFSQEAHSLKQGLENCESQVKMKKNLKPSSGQNYNLIEQLNSAKAQLQYLGTFREQLESLGRLDTAVKEAQIEVDKHCRYSYSDIEFEFKLAEAGLSKKITFIENQMVLRNSNALTPEQLDEFESVFRMFDRSGENALADDEFRAALESLDLSYSNEEYDELFRYLTSQNNEPKITFEQYIRFLVAIFEDQNNPSQMYDSFVTVSGGKPFVTIEDLAAAGLSEEQCLALASSMPKLEEGDELLDYNQFVDSLFTDLDA